MQDAVTIAVTGAPERPESSDRLRLIARNAFPFVVVGGIWEIIAWAGVFPHRLFPPLEGRCLQRGERIGHGSKQSRRSSGSSRDDWRNR